MQRRTGCAASVVVFVAGALISLHEVAAQQGATAPPAPGQRENQTPRGRPIDIGTAPAEGGAAMRHRQWDVVFDRTTSPRSSALDERWMIPGDPIAWSLRAQYTTHKSAFTAGVVQRGSQFPTYLTESLDPQGRYAISSGALRELTGQHNWDVVFRVDRRLVETREGATLDVFVQAFHPAGSSARRIDQTPVACSSALVFGAVIGF
jgi:hypothetical protein